MRFTKAFLPLVVAFAIAALSSGAFASQDEETKEPPRRHRAGKTVIRMDEPRGETRSWIEQHITIRKKVGLVYRHKVVTEDKRKLVLSVGGPVLKKKRFGLLFEIRF